MTSHDTNWNVYPAGHKPVATPLTNPTVHTQLSHRSIRAYTDEPVSEDAITTMMAAANAAPTWAFYQQRTIIRITDPKIRAVLGEISTQPYVGANHRGELFVFIVDLYRNHQIRVEKGCDTNWLSSTTAFLCGVEDTLLAAQNFALAAESLNLGSVFLGSVGADPQRVIDVLNLPRYTYPLVGLLVGHPDQEPQSKPRLPLAMISGCNTYPHHENYLPALADYDEVVTSYYDLREANRRLDTFTEQIATRMGVSAADNANVREVLAAQGLALF